MSFSSISIGRLPSSAGAGIAAWAREVARLSPNAWRRHLWLCALVGRYFLGAGLVEWHFTGTIGSSLRLYAAASIGLMAAMLVALLMIHAVYVMVAIRPKRLSVELGQQYRTSLFRPDRIAHA